MSKLKGITVILTKNETTNTDPFGSEEYTTTEIEVENVLVGQPSTDDITNSVNLYGKKAIYTLGIPKGDKNNWEDTIVLFFGKKWRTFGAVTQGIESMIPLDWNKKIMVESYE